MKKYKVMMTVYSAVNKEGQRELISECEFASCTSKGGATLIAHLLTKQNIETHPYGESDNAEIRRYKVIA